AGSWSLASLVPYVLGQAFARTPHRSLPLRSSSAGSTSSNERRAARGAAQDAALVALDVMERTKPDDPMGAQGPRACQRAVFAPTRAPIKIGRGRRPYRQT